MEYFDKIFTLIHVNIIYRLPCITVFFDGRGFAEHQLKIWDQLVKMLITLVPRGIFTSNFVYLCTLTLSSHCHANRWRGFAEHHFGRSSSFNENAHNSWTPWYNHFKFCILMYFNIVQPMPCKRWRGFTEQHFGRSSSFSENAHNSWTPWYICFKYCILMYYNIVQPLPCKTVTRLCRASFWPVELF